MVVVGSHLLPVWQLDAFSSEEDWLQVGYGAVLIFNTVVFDMAMNEGSQEQK